MDKQECFSEQQLDALRANYGKIKTVDPSSDKYLHLLSLLDSLKLAQLKQLAAAKIPFLSSLANNRVRALSAS